SGAAPMTSLPAGMKLPPALFSTSTVMPMLWLIFCATRRAVTSVPPPAARPTISRIGLPACSSWARAGSVSTARSKRPAPRTARTRDVIVASLSFGQQRSHDPLARQRQIADTLAERAGERIADRGAGGPDGGLAETERRLVRVVDQLDLDLRNVGETQDRVVV